MNEPIKQHYVPQSYLRFFSQKRKTIWEVVVVDKKNQKTYIANVRDVAFERNFYTVEELGEKKYTYEVFYAEQVEPLISKTFKQLISNCITVFSKDRDIVISNDLRGRISIILVTQLLRTPKARSYQYDISKKIFPTVIDNTVKSLSSYISPEQKKKLQTYNHDALFKEIDMSIITDVNRIESFTEVIFNKQWIVYLNNDYKKNPFVTSDHPVVQINMDSISTKLNDNGIARKNTIIHYPINSQLMLAIYDKQNFLFQFMDEMDGQLVYLNSEKDSNYISKVNQMQYEQCIQHVIYKPFS